MSYSHYFYILDLDQLQGLFGSKDAKAISKLSKDRPNSKPVLESIIAGEIDKNIEPAGYGYVLKALCENIGEQVGDDVSDIRDHPYESLMTSSGPPIAIPYDPTNFPQIGFIRAEEIEQELARIDAAPPPAGYQKSRSKRKGTAAKMADAIMDDVASYRQALKEAADKRLAIVSFRH